MNINVFTVRMDDETADKLRQLAEASDRSRGDVVRRLILAGVVEPAKMTKPVKINPKSIKPVEEAI